MHARVCKATKHFSYLISQREGEEEGRTKHQTALFAYIRNSFLLPETLVNVITNSTAEYYRCAESDSAALSAGLLRRHLTCPRGAPCTSKHRLSIPRVRLIALNQISSANAFRVARVGRYTYTYAAYARTRVPVVKDFIVMNLIFIQTIPVACSLSSLSLSLYLFCSRSLSFFSPSLSLFGFPVISFSISLSLPVPATLDEPSVTCQCRRGLQGT